MKWKAEGKPGAEVSTDWHYGVYPVMQGCQAWVKVPALKKLGEFSSKDLAKAACEQHAMENP